MTIPRSELVVNCTSILFGAKVERVLAYVNNGINVHVVGPRFSGRSALLREVGLRLTESGHNILRISGNPAWRNEPLGALVAAGIVKEPNVRMLGDALTTVGRLVAQRSPVILSDKTSDIDNATAGLLLAVLRDSGTPMVTINLRNTRTSSSPLVAGLSPAVTVRIDTLDLNQLQELANAILGDPLDMVALSRLARASGGLYELAKTLLVIGRQNGQIVRGDQGIYRIAGDLWSSDVLWLAERLTQGISDDLLLAAARLSKRGLLTIDEAEELIGVDGLVRLLNAGLAYRTHHYGNPTVTLYPGLFIDYLEHEIAPFSPYTVMTEGIASPPEFRELTSEFTSMDVGIIAQQLRQEAIERVDSLRPDWVASRSPHEAIPLLDALLAASPPDDEIETVLAGTVVDADESYTTEFLMWKARWLASQDRDEEAVSVLRQHREEHPENEAAMRVAEAQVLFARNGILPPDLLVPPADDVHQSAKRLYANVAIQVDLAAGRTETARARLAEFQPTKPRLIFRKAAWQTLATMLEGRIDDAIEQAIEHLRTSFSLMTTESIDSFQYVAVLALFTSGRIDQAQQALSNIVASSLPSSFRSAFHSGILSTGALVSLYEGNLTTARAMAVQSELSASVPGPFPGMSTDAIRAIVDYDSEGANHASDLWRYIGERLDRDYVASGLFIACEALEQGIDSLGVVERLRDLLPQIESPFLTTAARYVIAACERDLDQLAAAVDEFRGYGAGLYATKAAVTLAVELRAAGRASEAMTTATRAWETAVVAGHPSHVVFARLINDVGLSAREGEITQHVADGMPYADIANLLDLSTRTVETHLLNVARKAGAVNRKQLIEAIQTWLKPSVA